MKGEGGGGGGGRGPRDMIFVIDSFYTNYVKPWTSHGKDLQTLCCSGLGNLSVAWIWWKDSLKIGFFLVLKAGTCYQVIVPSSSFSSGLNSRDCGMDSRTEK